MIVMKKKNYIKFGLDLLMAVAFVLFFNKRVLGGLSFHEIAGLAFAAAFFTHILLNWRWVKNVSLKLFDKKLPGKTRFGYFLNLFLLVTMSFIIISGVFISKVVFPNINIGNERWFQTTHISISFLVLILVAAHVGLHWKWVVNVFNKIIKAKKHGRIRGILARVTIIALLGVGVYEMYTTNFVMHLEGVSQVFSYSSAQAAGGESHGGGRPDFAGGERPEFGEGEFTGERSGFQQGEFEGGEKPEGFKGGKEGHMGNANVIGVLFTYFSIMSVFVIITYYLDKFILGRRKKRAYNPSMT